MADDKEEEFMRERTLDEGALGKVYLVSKSQDNGDKDSRNNGSRASGSGANGQGSQAGQRRSRGQDDREGYIMHPTRGKLPTYIFYKRHNVHMYMDKDTGSWMRLPIGWELNQPLVKELVNQVEEAIPHWNDRHEILAMLRSCNYDPDECINTYTHLEGDEWLKVPMTAKDAKAFVAKDEKIAELEMKVRNLEIEVQKYKTQREEAEALASPALPSTSSCADESMLSGAESHNLGSSLETTIPSSLSTISSEDSGMDNIAEPVKSAEKQIPGEKIQKDEPVFELQHITHDFIEKDDSFTVHIYVKEIKKDAVRVNFEPQTLIVRFQTGDKRFLQLHKMNEDMVFLWKIQLRGEIVPEKSKHKISSSLIDITLGKKEFTRWGDLAALKRKRPRQEWSQTDNTVALTLRIDECPLDQLKDIGVEFTDKSVTLTLPDKRKWSWTLAEEIVREESRVKVSKKHKIALQMKKKNEIHWKTYEASPALPSTSSCADESMLSGTESHNLGSSLETTIPNSLSTISSEDSGMDNIAEPVKSAEKQIPGEKIQKDEPVFELQHITHDFIEKDDSFTVHIYVKEIKKDAVRVNFEPQTLIVRFQTGDKRFLQLHKMNEDMVFLWKIQLRGEIVPEKSKHKISSSLIDITLGKKEFTRWGDLAALKRKRPRQEWSQTDNTVALTLRIDECPLDQLKDIGVEFTDKSVTLTLPDKRKWSWTLAEEIVREESRVKVSKKHKIALQMKKKNEIHWKTYEASPALPSTSSCADESMLSGTESHNLGSSLETTIPNSLSTISSEDSGMDNIAEPVKSAEKQIPGEKIQKDEPVFELQHITHDFIEKDDSFTVHIYVKEIKKDAVKVNFEPQTLIVRFQTGDKRFLQLHKMNEDMVFLWKIQLRGEIVPEKSKHKISSSLIDITLGKKEFTRWGDLAALKRKSPPESPSQSDTWININQVKPAALPSSRNSPDDENQARKERDIKREKSEINKGKENKTNQNEANKENVAQQTPTCKVSPLKKNALATEILVSPGMTGLDNLGNTCFMNSVLQCLANTREFRDIFLDSSFKSDLNTSNSLGTGGKLAMSFAILMKVLWSGHHYSYAPSKLKSLVALKASQFTGFAKHDAQQFMAFLLDGLHEDLNRVRKKPYTQTVKDRGRPDDVVASEAWEVYKKRNDSFIVDMFQGQYKSKLVCPECGKVSITFDPFVYLSLPLPKKQRLLPVTFFSKDLTYKKPVRYMLKLAKDSAVENLKELLYRKTGVHPTNIRVFEAFKGKFQKIFHRGSDLGSVQTNDEIIACEVLSKDLAGEEVYEINVIQRTVMPNQLPTCCCYCKRQCPPDEKLKQCTKCLKVGYCNQQCQKNHWQIHRPFCKLSPHPVGCPFIISIPQSRATFSRISKLMEAYARYSVDVFQPPVINDNMPSMSSQLSTSNLSSSSSRSSGSLSIQTGETGHNSPPFFLKPVDQDGIGLSGPDGERLEDEEDAALDLSGLHFLSMDWKNNEKHPGYVLVQTKELEVENDESMMTASLDEVNTAYLSQCLELFTEPEVLSQEEAWYCPQCKEHREATKEMSIWKLPHTLIVQLKRDLDLSPYYVGARPANEPPPIYDLYAVVNHHGGILGGHYTAYVRCADVNDHKKNLVGWRLCDDSRVSNISHEKNVVTRAAYLLFYRRREPFILPERFIPSPESDNKEEEEEAVTKEKELNGKDETIPQLGSLNKMSVELAKHDELPEIGQMSDDKFVPPFSDNIEDNDLAVDSVSVTYTDMDSVD